MSEHEPPYDHEPPHNEEPPDDYDDREPPDDDEEPPDDYGDREPPDDEEPPDDFDPADYQPDDYEPQEPDDFETPDWDEIQFAEHERQIYEDAVEQFTKERLQSHYLANPLLGVPAHEALTYAQTLLPSHPQAALLFATTAMELAVKVVLLRPIVSGLVHTEGMAGFITELATQHTGMERFQELLTKILADFGKVDLKTYKRPNSKGTLWQEMSDVQRARNAVAHRGEKVKDSMAHLAVAVAATLLQRILPTILDRLDLKLEPPITIRLKAD